MAETAQPYYYSTRFEKLIGDRASRVKSHFEEHLYSLKSDAEFQFCNLSFYRNTSLVRILIDQVDIEPPALEDGWEPFFYFLFFFDRNEEKLVPIGDENEYIYRANLTLDNTFNNNSALDYAQFFLDFTTAKNVDENPLRFKLLRTLNDVEYRTNDITVMSEVKGALWTLLEGTDDDELQLKPASDKLRHEVEKLRFRLSEEYAFIIPVQFKDAIFKARFIIQKGTGECVFEDDTEVLLYRSNQISECRGLRRHALPLPKYLKRADFLRRLWILPMKVGLSLIVIASKIAGPTAGLLLLLFILSDYAGSHVGLLIGNWLGDHIGLHNASTFVGALSFTILGSTIVLWAVKNFLLTMGSQLGPQLRDMLRSQRKKMIQKYNKLYQRLVLALIYFFTSVFDACIAFAGLQYSFGNSSNGPSFFVKPLFFEAMRSVPGANYLFNALGWKGDEAIFAPWIIAGFRIFIVVVVLRGIYQFWESTTSVRDYPKP